VHNLRHGGLFLTVLGGLVGGRTQKDEKRIQLFDNFQEDGSYEEMNGLTEDRQRRNVAIIKLLNNRMQWTIVGPCSRLWSYYSILWQWCHFQWLLPTFYLCDWLLPTFYLCDCLSYYLHSTCVIGYYLHSTCVIGYYLHFTCVIELQYLHVTGPWHRQ